MSEHNEVGRIGEDLAREYLEKKGYKIIEQNYKSKYSEIDLVTEKSQGFFGEKELVFVEVRTKIGENFGTPEDTLKKKKLSKVRFGAISYSAFKKWTGPIKVDAICIVLKPDYSVDRLTHHENIV